MCEITGVVVGTCCVSVRLSYRPGGGSGSSSGSLQFPHGANTDHTPLLLASRDHQQPQHPGYADPFSQSQPLYTNPFSSAQSHPAVASLPFSRLPANTGPAEC